MNRKLLQVLSALLICALMLTACGQQAEVTEEKAAGIAVQVETVTSNTISATNRVSGAISADNEVMIMIASAAKCIAVYAQAGDIVVAGQKICTLDMDSTLANKSAAQIGYDSAVQSRREQKAVLDAQVALQQKNLDATKALFEIGAASQMEVDSAQLQLDSAKATRNSTIGQLDAAVEQAKAGLEQLGMALDYMDSEGNVIAPIDGVLVSMNAVENNYVSTSMPVAVIDGLDEMKVTVSVSEALVPKLNAGDTADIYVSAIDTSFRAVIRSVERAVNMQTRLYTVVLEVPEGVSGLISGMFANVTFHTEVSENAIVIPTEAIMTKNDMQHVYVVEDGVAHYVEIVTGLTGNGVTEVVSGLAAGQQLVTVGQAYLVEGDPVRIVGRETESDGGNTAEKTESPQNEQPVAAEG